MNFRLAVVLLILAAVALAAYAVGGWWAVAFLLVGFAVTFTVGVTRGNRKLL